MRRAVELTRPAPHVFEEELPENINGVYDELTHIIVIDPRLNERQKRCTLAHELLHWTHGDARCQSQYDDKAETHVRKETATLLIIRSTTYSPNECTRAKRSSWPSI